MDLGTTTNERVVLRQRPEGLLTKDDVELQRGVPVPELDDGEALIEVEWIGIDATVRTWLSKAEGYLPAVELGEAVRASGIGRVVATRCETFPLGHRVYGLPGWQRYGVVRDDPLATHLGTEVDAPAMLSVYGATGLTAYVGIVDVGAAKEGETVVVSAAAGATGSLAAQIAKIRGCRVIGICGSRDKARWLTEDLGLDGAINHRADDVRGRLADLCPDRVDVYFDNVGGPILDVVLDRLAMHARVVLCGAIAIYNEHGRPPGPSNYFQLINRRARMEGFLSLDHWDRFPEVAATLGGWMAEGKLHYRTQVYEGLDAAVDALNALFTGANTGKTVIRL
ncbi:MAG: NADP-dependent oxidoreductase [Acidimicrobiales bacterium]|nr:NADP-dependent oxidoreductase [Acidimicrobiales bacterium]